MDGFLSASESQNKLIEELGADREMNMNGQKGGKGKYSQKEANGKAVSSSQQKKAELEEIDQIMEEIIADEEEEDENELIEACGLEQEKDEFSPTQPVLLSQKAELLQDSQRLKANELDQKSEKCSLEDILGVDGLKSPDDKQDSVKESSKEQGVAGKTKLQKDIYRITNNEEKISNSSSPLINESLQKQQEMEENQNLIEINVEMTEEQKKQEQSLNFGATPYSAKSNSIISSLNKNVNPSSSILGQSVDALQN